MTEETSQDSGRDVEDVFYDCVESNKPEECEIIDNIRTEADQGRNDYLFYEIMNCVESNIIEKLNDENKQLNKAIANLIKYPLDRTYFEDEFCIKLAVHDFGFMHCYLVENGSKINNGKPKISNSSTNYSYRADIPPHIKLYEKKDFLIKALKNETDKMIKYIQDL